MKKWIDGEEIEMSAEEEAEFEASRPTIAQPLLPLTPRQIRLGLLAGGITEAMVDAALTDPHAIIEWKYASQYKRDHPLVAGLGAAFGLSEAQIDGMWQAAQQL